MGNDLIADHGWLLQSDLRDVLRDCVGTEALSESNEGQQVFTVSLPCVYVCVCVWASWCEASIGR